MLNWQWVLSDILGENSIKKRRSNSFQKAFERRLCFDRMAGVTGIFERISFLLQKSLFVFHGHRISFCGIYIQLSEMGEKVSEAAGNLEEAAGCFEELIGYLVAAKGEEKNEEEKTDE